MSSKPFRLPGLPSLTAAPGSVPAPADGLANQADLLIAVDRLYRGIEDAGAQFVRQRGGLPLCVEGCGRCCKANTPMMTALEAQHALGSFAVAEAALDRARDWLTTPHPEAPTLPRTQPRAVGGDSGLADFTAAEAQGIDRERAALAGLPCPFLAEDQRCMVYQGRPLSCRVYGIGVAPDAFCARPLAPGEGENLRQFINAVGEGAELAAETLHRTAEQRVDPMAGSAGFAPAVLLAVARPEEFARLVESGKVALAKIGMRRPGLPYPGVLSQRRKDGLIAAFAAAQPQQSLSQTAAAPAAK